MLTLAMPQSLPVGGQEPLGLAQVVGEDARRQALRHVVVQRDRLLDVRVRHRVEDRREGLLAHDVGLSPAFDDRGSDVVSRPAQPVGQHALAAADGAAVGARPGRAPSACRRSRLRRSAGRRACRRSQRVADLHAGVGPARAARSGCPRPTRARSAGAASCSAGRGADGGEQRSRAPPGRGRRWASTIIALLPPSSSSARPKRAATLRRRPRGPCAVEPVALTPAARRGSSTSASPTALPPITTCDQALRGVAEALDRLLGTAPDRRARSAASSLTASRPPDRRTRARAPRSTPRPRPGS